MRFGRRKRFESEEMGHPPIADADAEHPDDEDSRKTGARPVRCDWPFTVRDKRVMRALGKVPREAFIPEAQRSRAGENRALSIGFGQTISQPYVVAVMTELLKLTPGCRVLEIGTGSGYQSAILSELSNEVYTVELIEALAQKAQEVLRRLNYRGIQFRIGDGQEGWPEFAPYDGIIVTCAAEKVPASLWDQLKSPSGRMIIPIGDSPDNQELLLFQKTAEADRPPTPQRIFPVRFVPMRFGGQNDAAG